MGERSISIVGAMGMLAVFVLLIYTPAQQPQVSLPTSIEAEANGYLGLSRWLQHHQIETVSWRRRFQDLEQAFSGGDGHLLISSYPYKTATSHDDVEALHAWIAEGSTLVLVTALNDTPDWALAAPVADFLDGLEELSRLEFEELTDADGTRVEHGTINPFIPTPLTIKPSASHPLMAGVEVLVGETDLPSALWIPTTATRDYLALELAVLADSSHPTMWQIPYEKGFIIVYGVSDTFTNAMLGKEDNARLLANMVGLHLDYGAHFIFDDYHQGLSELYDAEAFFGDERLHNTLLFLLAFWFIYVVGASMRLGGYHATPEVAHQIDYVRALAGFLRRKLSPRDIGLELVHNFIEYLIKSGKIHAHDDPWPQLRAMPMVDEHVLQRIHQAYARLGAGEKTNLKELTNLINNLKRRIG